MEKKVVEVRDCIEFIFFGENDMAWIRVIDENEAEGVTCTPKITPVGRQESNKMRKGDSCDEKGTYGRADRWDNAWV